MIKLLYWCSQTTTHLAADNDHCLLSEPLREFVMLGDLLLKGDNTDHSLRFILLTRLRLWPPYYGPFIQYLWPQYCQWSLMHLWLAEAQGWILHLCDFQIQLKPLRKSLLKLFSGAWQMYSVLLQRSNLWSSYTWLWPLMHLEPVVCCLA